MVTYLRLALSATKRTDRSPFSFIKESMFFLKSTSHHAQIKKVHGDEGLQLMKPAREQASTRPKPIQQRLRKISRLLLLVRSRRKKIDQAGQRYLCVRVVGCFRSSCPRARVQHYFPGSSTIELPSALTESDACSPQRACHGTLARAAASCYQVFRVSTHLPLACRHLPKGTKLELRSGASGGDHPHTTQPP